MGKGQQQRLDLNALLGAFARERSFRGADLETARRLGRAGWLVLGVVGYGLLPLHPPTDRIGAAGWLIAGLLGVCNLSLYWWLFGAPNRATFNWLLVLVYFGVVNIAAFMWLGGGLPAPYHELYPFLIVAAAAIHPPRRFLPFMAVLAAAALAPELGHASADEASALIAELVVWLGAAVIVNALMWSIRQHRADLQEGQAQARELARLDQLTGLANRRAFEESLEREVARVKRSGGALSLVMCDLDGFKSINDRFGHLTGDQCLRRVAAALQNELRVADACFRWGGDEFVALLSGTDRAGAEETAARLRLAVAETCTRPDGAPMRISAAPATLALEMTGEELVAIADRQLRDHKQRERIPA